jgi:ELWxxDGT repeat protein
LAKSSISDPNDELWVTDRTNAGTYELAVAGANTLFGLSPSDLVTFGNEIMFSGLDTSGIYGLWITDGTVAGTQEITVNGAYTGQYVGLSPQSLTVFKGAVFFSGDDAAGNLGLWTTDGTTAGTHEITGITGGSKGGAWIQPTALTVLNSNLMLFEGLDAASRLGLWVTDGTGAGTHELTGISGANPSGLFYSLDNPGFAVLNGKALFEGDDAAGNHGLWITDGTVAGTHELTGISGASASGIAPSDITIFNGEAVFVGRRERSLQSLGDRRYGCRNARAHGHLQRIYRIVWFQRRICSWEFIASQSHRV